MSYDAVIVGAGPNGLAAAVTLARAGRSVLVVEANSTVGGAARSGALTRPGFVHDLGSAIHPLGVGSPFFSSLPLEDYGLRWIHPGVPLAHPLDGGRAAVLYRSLGETAAALAADGGPYRTLFGPFVDAWPALAEDILRPIPHVPRHPVRLAAFGLRALQSADGLARRFFRDDPARALFAGIAAHSGLHLQATASAAIGLVLGVAGHAVGWPMPEGGAGRIAEALAVYLQDLGGEIQTGRRVGSLDELPPARAVLLDVTPRGLLALAGDRLPAAYRRRLEAYRYGHGVYKLDYALDGPIPWAAPEVARAGTVHVGGTLDEVAASEAAVAQGRHPERPFVLLAQPTQFDATRAPAGGHVAWAYCHVPNGSTFDMSDRIERQIERFAPGFRERVLARRASAPADLERQNANLVGGDVNGGASDVVQLVARPVPTPWPYRTPLPGVYLCSASTPPGGGVHGMCGYHAARLVLRDEKR